MTHGTIKNVVEINCNFNEASTSASRTTGFKLVAMKEHAMQTKMPAAEIVRGYNNAAQPASRRSEDVEAMTRAAHVASAREPNKSEPMPATSPTLSPTLSAMVAGLRGSSSSNPWTTLPTKSAP